MAVLFFDSSALVKRYAKEPGSAWVRGLTKPKATHTLYIARITAVEITSAITQKLRGGQLSAAQAGASLGHLRRHLNHRYSILDLTPGLADDAMRLARAHGLKAYDAVQLLPWHRRSSYEPDAPARGVPQSPRWRVGLVCAKDAKLSCRGNSHCTRGQTNLSGGRLHPDYAGFRRP